MKPVQRLVESQTVDGESETAKSWISRVSNYSDMVFKIIMLTVQLSKNSSTPSKQLNDTSVMLGHETMILSSCEAKLVSSNPLWPPISSDLTHPLKFGFPFSIDRKNRRSDVVSTMIG